MRNFNFIKKPAYAIDAILRRPTRSLILFSLLPFFCFYFTYKHPLYSYDNGRAKNVIEWIRSNTPEDSIFLTTELDTFIIRVYGRRAIFADRTFVLNESYMKEFSDRLAIYNKSKHFTPSDYACLKKIYNVDYIILSDERKILSHTPSFHWKKWFVYETSKFKLTGECNKKGSDAKHR